MGQNLHVLTELFLCVCLQTGYSHSGSLFSSVTGAFWLTTVQAKCVQLETEPGQGPAVSSRI